LAAFQTQHAATFKELRELVQQVEAISHCLACDGTLSALLTDYTAANSAASFADKEVWNALQSRKGQALLELTPLLDGWRQEARTILTDAVDRLSNDLAERGLDGTLAESLSAPLIQLRDSLDATTLPSSVAAFPERARTLVRSLGQRIASEVAKKQRPHPPGTGQGGAGTPPTLPPTRKVRVVRISEVATVTRISSKEEWIQLSSKLDQQVRKLLAEGVDVELG
ncbi:MAG TPA: hypothetical protein VK137_04920, partial [Planctomycetaceae bacterium]|nr:hypothetical protein [Planctomycetaceae bacterium]